MRPLLPIIGAGPQILNQKIEKKKGERGGGRKTNPQMSRPSLQPRNVRLEGLPEDHGARGDLGRQELVDGGVERGVDLRAPVPERAHEDAKGVGLLVVVPAELALVAAAVAGAEDLLDPPPEHAVLQGVSELPRGAYQGCGYGSGERREW